MRKFSEDKYNFKSTLNLNEINVRLNNRTLIKKNLTMEFTDKDFIGKISENTFSIFDSSFFPYGAACVLNGEIKPTSEIRLTSTLHKGFRILFLVWLVAMTGLIIVFSLITDSLSLQGIIAVIIGFSVMAFLFRLFFHGLYTVARNRGLNKMKKILEIAE